MPGSVTSRASRRSASGQRDIIYLRGDDAGEQRAHIHGTNMRVDGCLAVPARVEPGLAPVLTAPPQAHACRLLPIRL
jgi:hypothetical protein